MIYVVAPNWGYVEEWARRSGLRPHDVSYVGDGDTLRAMSGVHEPRVMILGWDPEFRTRFGALSPDHLLDVLRRHEARVQYELSDAAQRRIKIRKEFASFSKNTNANSIVLSRADDGQYVPIGTVDDFKVKSFEKTPDDSYDALTWLVTTQLKIAPTKISDDAMRTLFGTP